MELNTEKGLKIAVENAATQDYRISHATEFTKELLLQSIQSSCLGPSEFPEPDQTLTVENQRLKAKFSERLNQMKSDSRTPEERSVTYAFYLLNSIDKNYLPRIFSEGLESTELNNSYIGDAAKGVYLCSKADVLLENYFAATGENSACIAVFKVLLGKMRVVEPVVEGNPLPPTPGYESHVSTPPHHTMNIFKKTVHSQVYLFEFKADGTISKKPSHCCPIALLVYHDLGQKMKKPLSVAVPQLPKQSPVENHFSCNMSGVNSPNLQAATGNSQQQQQQFAATHMQPLQQPHAAGRHLQQQQTAPGLSHLLQKTNTRQMQISQSDRQPNMQVKQFQVQTKTYIAQRVQVAGQQMTRKQLTGQQMTGKQLTGQQMTGKKGTGHASGQQMIAKQVTGQMTQHNVSAQQVTPQLISGQQLTGQQLIGQQMTGQWSGLGSSQSGMNVINLMKQQPQPAVQQNNMVYSNSQSISPSKQQSCVVSIVPQSMPAPLQWSGTGQVQPPCQTVFLQTVGYIEPQRRSDASQNAVTPVPLLITDVRSDVELPTIDRTQLSVAPPVASEGNMSVKLQDSQAGGVTYCQADARQNTEGLTGLRANPKVSAQPPSTQVSAQPPPPKGQGQAQEIDQGQAEKVSQGQCEKVSQGHGEENQQTCMDLELEYLTKVMQDKLKSTNTNITSVKVETDGGPHGRRNRGRIIDTIDLTKEDDDTDEPVNEEVEIDMGDKELEETMSATEAQLKRTNLKMSQARLRALANPDVEKPPRIWKGVLCWSERLLDGTLQSTHMATCRIYSVDGKRHSKAKSMPRSLKCHFLSEQFIDAMAHMINSSPSFVAEFDQDSAYNIILRNAVSNSLFPIAYHGMEFAFIVKLESIGSEDKKFFCYIVPEIKLLSHQYKLQRFKNLAAVTQKSWKSTTSPPTAQTSNQPHGSVQTSHQPNGSLQTLDRPHGSVQTSHQPDSSVQTSHQPDGSVQTSHQPPGSVQTSHQPHGSEQTSHQPHGSVQTSHQPDGSVQTSHQPHGSVQTSHQLHASVQTSHQPYASVETSHQPHGSVQTSEQPHGSVETSHQPDGSVQTSDQPDGSVQASHQPDGSVQTSDQPHVSSQRRLVSNQNLSTGSNPAVRPPCDMQYPAQPQASEQRIPPQENEQSVNSKKRDPPISTCPSVATTSASHPQSHELLKEKSSKSQILDEAIASLEKMLQSDRSMQCKSETQSLTQSSSQMSPECRIQDSNHILCHKTHAQDKQSQGPQTQTHGSSSVYSQSSKVIDWSHKASLDDNRSADSVTNAEAQKTQNNNNISQNRDTDLSNPQLPVATENNQSVVKEGENKNVTVNKLLCRLSKTLKLAEKASNESNRVTDQTDTSSKQKMLAKKSSEPDQEKNSHQNSKILDSISSQPFVDSCNEDNTCDAPSKQSLTEGQPTESSSKQPILSATRSVGTHRKKTRKTSNKDIIQMKEKSPEKKKSHSSKQKLKEKRIFTNSYQNLNRMIKKHKKFAIIQAQKKMAKNCKVRVNEDGSVEVVVKMGSSPESSPDIDSKKRQCSFMPKSSPGVLVEKDKPCPLSCKKKTYKSPSISGKQSLCLEHECNMNVKGSINSDQIQNSGNKHPIRAIKNNKTSDENVSSNDVNKTETHKRLYAQKTSHGESSQNKDVPKQVTPIERRVTCQQGSKQSQVSPPSRVSQHCMDERHEQGSCISRESRNGPSVAAKCSDSLFGELKTKLMEAMQKVYPELTPNPTIPCTNIGSVSVARKLTLSDGAVAPVKPNKPAEPTLSQNTVNVNTGSSSSESKKGFRRKLSEKFSELRMCEQPASATVTSVGSHSHTNQIQHQTNEHTCQIEDKIKEQYIEGAKHVYQKGSQIEKGQKSDKECAMQTHQENIQAQPQYHQIDKNVSEQAQQINRQTQKQHHRKDKHTNEQAHQKCEQTQEHLYPKDKHSSQQAPQKHKEKQKQQYSKDKNISEQTHRKHKETQEQQYQTKTEHISELTHKEQAENNPVTERTHERHKQTKQQVCVNDRQVDEQKCQKDKQIEKDQTEEPKSEKRDYLKNEQACQKVEQTNEQAFQNDTGIEKDNLKDNEKIDQAHVEDVQIQRQDNQTHKQIYSDNKPAQEKIIMQGGCRVNPKGKQKSKLFLHKENKSIMSSNKSQPIQKFTEKQKKDVNRPENLQTEPKLKSVISDTEKADVSSLTTIKDSEINVDQKEKLQVEEAQTFSSGKLEKVNITRAKPLAANILSTYLRKEAALKKNITPVLAQAEDELLNVSLEGASQGIGIYTEKEASRCVTQREALDEQPELQLKDNIKSTEYGTSTSADSQRGEKDRLKGQSQTVVGKKLGVFEKGENESFPVTDSDAVITQEKIGESEQHKEIERKESHLELSNHIEEQEPKKKSIINSEILNDAVSPPSSNFQEHTDSHRSEVQREKKQINLNFQIQGSKDSSLSSQEKRSEVPPVCLQLQEEKSLCPSPQSTQERVSQQISQPNEGKPLSNTLDSTAEKTSSPSQETVTDKTGLVNNKRKRSDSMTEFIPVRRKSVTEISTMNKILTDEKGKESSIQALKTDAESVDLTLQSQETDKGNKHPEISVKPNAQIVSTAGKSHSSKTLIEKQTVLQKVVFSEVLPTENKSDTSEGESKEKKLSLSNALVQNINMAPVSSAVITKGICESPETTPSSKTTASPVKTPIAPKTTTATAKVTAAMANTTPTALKTTTASVKTPVPPKTTTATAKVTAAMANTTPTALKTTTASVKTPVPPKTTTATAKVTAAMANTTPTALKTTTAPVKTPIAPKTTTAKAKVTAAMLVTSTTTLKTTATPVKTPIAPKTTTATAKVTTAMANTTTTASRKIPVAPNTATTVSTTTTSPVKTPIAPKTTTATATPAMANTTTTTSKTTTSPVKTPIAPKTTTATAKITGAMANTTTAASKEIHVAPNTTTTVSTTTITPVKTPIAPKTTTATVIPAMANTTTTASKEIPVAPNTTTTASTTTTSPMKTPIAPKTATATAKVTAAMPETTTTTSKTTITPVKTPIAPMTTTATATPAMPNTMTTASKEIPVAPNTTTTVSTTTITPVKTPIAPKTTTATAKVTAAMANRTITASKETAVAIKTISAIPKEIKTAHATLAFSQPKPPKEPPLAERLISESTKIVEEMSTESEKTSTTSETPEALFPTTNTKPAAQKQISAAKTPTPKITGAKIVAPKSSPAASEKMLIAQVQPADATPTGQSETTAIKKQTSSAIETKPKRTDQPVSISQSTVTNATAAKQTDLSAGLTKSVPSTERSKKKTETSEKRVQGVYRTSKSHPEAPVVKRSKGFVSTSKTSATNAKKFERLKLLSKSVHSTAKSHTARSQGRSRSSQMERHHHESRSPRRSRLPDHRTSTPRYLKRSHWESSLQSRNKSEDTKKRSSQLFDASASPGKKKKKAPFKEGSDMARSRTEKPTGKATIFRFSDSPVPSTCSLEYATVPDPLRLIVAIKVKNKDAEERRLTSECKMCHWQEQFSLLMHIDINILKMHSTEQKTEIRKQREQLIQQEWNHEYKKNIERLQLVEDHTDIKNKYNKTRKSYSKECIRKPDPCQLCIKQEGKHDCPATEQTRLVNHLRLNIKMMEEKMMCRYEPFSLGQTHERVPMQWLLPEEANTFRSVEGAAMYLRRPFTWEDFRTVVTIKMDIEDLRWQLRKTPRADKERVDHITEWLSWLHFRRFNLLIGYTMRIGHYQYKSMCKEIGWKRDLLNDLLSMPWSKGVAAKVNFLKEKIRILEEHMTAVNNLDKMDSRKRKIEDVEDGDTVTNQEGSASSHYREKRIRRDEKYTSQHRHTTRQGHRNPRDSRSFTSSQRYDWESRS